MDSFWEKQRELSLIITKSDAGVGSALKSYSSLFLFLAFFFFSLSKVVHSSLNSVVCLLSFVIGFLKTWQQKKASPRPRPLSEQSKAAACLSITFCLCGGNEGGGRERFICGLEFMATFGHHNSHMVIHSQIEDIYTCGC